jgi:hypothetical protein
MESARELIMRDLVKDTEAHAPVGLLASAYYFALTANGRDALPVSVRVRRSTFDWWEKAQLCSLLGLFAFLVHLWLCGEQCMTNLCSIHLFTWCRLLSGCGARCAVWRATDEHAFLTCISTVRKSH